jgi:hypothetical protein
MTWSLWKLRPSIESAIEDPRLWIAFSGIMMPPLGGELLGVRFGEAGGERFEISIMALVALFFSSTLSSVTTWLALSVVTTGSAAWEKVWDRMARGNGMLSDLSKLVAAAVDAFGKSEADGFRPLRDLTLALAGLDS